jgi:hypothetical protein
MGKDPKTDMAATILALLLTEDEAPWALIMHTVVQAHGDHPHQTVRYNLNKLIRIGLVARRQRGVFAIAPDVQRCDAACRRKQPHLTGWCAP